MADCYFRLNNFEQARIEFESLLKNYPDSALIAEVQYRIAMTYALEGKLPEAAAAYRLVMERWPDSPYALEASFGLATVLEEQEKLLEAWRFWKAWLEFIRNRIYWNAKRHRCVNGSKRKRRRSEVSSMMKIGVIGAGSWGTTLANVLAKKGFDVTLWVYEAELVERLPETRVNDLYLDGITLAANLAYTNDLADAVVGRQVLVLVSPSQVMRRVLKQLAPHLEDDCLLVSAAKGIENDTLLTMSEVLPEVLGPGSQPAQRLSLRALFCAGGC